MTDVVMAGTLARRTKYPGAGMCGRLGQWANRLRQIERARRELNSLTDRELGDIGLSRCQINSVASQTFPRDGQ